MYLCMYACIYVGMYVGMYHVYYICKHTIRWFLGAAYNYIHTHYTYVIYLYIYTVEHYLCVYSYIIYIDRQAHMHTYCINRPKHKYVYLPICISTHRHAYTRKHLYLDLRGFGEGRLFST